MKRVIVTIAFVLMISTLGWAQWSANDSRGDGDYGYGGAPPPSPSFGSRPSRGGYSQVNTRNPGRGCYDRCYSRYGGSTNLSANRALLKCYDFCR
jgi:hypothetical protein